MKNHVKGGWGGVSALTALRWGGSAAVPRMTLVYTVGSKLLGLHLATPAYREEK